MKKLYLLTLLIISSLTACAQLAPEAVNDTADVIENGAIYINVLANDTNFNPMDNVCVTALYGGQPGWQAVSGCVDVEFHPLDPNFTGLDTFHYISCDQTDTALCDTGQVIVRVYPAPRPTAFNDSASIPEDGSILLNVLSNNINPNYPDSVCITAVYGGQPGWASIANCTDVIFHPLNPTFTGLDTFYYISCDRVMTSLCDTGMVIMSVIIRAPVGVNDTVALIEGDTLLLNVLAIDSNFNPQDSIRISGLIGTPVGAALILDSTKLEVYSTNSGYIGLDTFYYRACDMTTGLCDTALVFVNIMRAPIVYPDTATMIQPDTAYLEVLAGDSNFNTIDSACVTYVWGLPASGWATIEGCGVIAYAPTDLNYSGIDTFYYSACYTQTPTVCDTSMVIVHVILPIPLVDFTWAEDSPCVAQVYNNSVLADSIVWTVQYLTQNGINDTLYNVNQFALSSDMADSGFDVQVCQTAYNRTGDSTLCYTFWIQCSSGNSGIAALPVTSHLSVYPDPASGQIQIDLSKIDPVIWDKTSYIVIYDMPGAALRSIPAGEMSGSISISDLSEGIYLIGLLDQNGNKQLMGKFEVMR